MDEANAIVQRLFERAAERVGSPHALGQCVLITSTQAALR